MDWWDRIFFEILNKNEISGGLRSSSSHKEIHRALHAQVVTHYAYPQEKVWKESVKVTRSDQRCWEITGCKDQAMDQKGDHKSQNLTFHSSISHQAPIWNLMWRVRQK